MQGQQPLQRGAVFSYDQGIGMKASLPDVYHATINASNANQLPPSTVTQAYNNSQHNLKANKWSVSADFQTNLAIASKIMVDPSTMVQNATGGLKSPVYQNNTNQNSARNGPGGRGGKKGKDLDYSKYGNPPSLTGKRERERGGRSHSRSPLRSRSRSFSRSRSRSWSRSNSPAKRGRKDPRGGRKQVGRNRDAPAVNPTANANLGRAPTAATPTNAATITTTINSNTSNRRSSDKVDYANLSASQLIEQFQAPSITKNLHSLTAVDLYTKFPKLYVPADLVHISIDWEGMYSALHNDIMTDITLSVPILFENTPSMLRSDHPSSSTAESSGNINAAATAAIATISSSNGNFPSEIFSVSDALDPQKFTYLTVERSNNLLYSLRGFSSALFQSVARPIKFNARVIVSCGFKDPVNERVDHNLARKLR